MEWYEYLLVFFGGYFAGTINALAGFGSLITLTLLMEVIGLSPNVANGTNRVNVMANAFAASTGFVQNGKLRLSKVWPIIALVLSGTLVGAYIATNISDSNFRNIYRGLVVLVAILLLTRPKRWLIKESLDRKINWFIAVPLFIILGIYAGLVQAGAGMFFLAILVLFVRKEIFEANAIKMFTILCYSIFVIYMFHSKGLIDWKAGALLALAQAMGAYVTSRLAPKLKNANLWAYRLLIIIVFGIIAREIYFFL